ncbi:MAG: aminotransferase class V-fold PLP-dependent enzyme [Clostridia bacterium]
MKTKLLCKSTYLDNAATSRYKPRAVIRAVNKHLKHSANPGRGGHRDSISAGLTLELAREQIRRLVGEGEVILTKSCTEALNIAIFGIEPKGEVITSVFEHNSVLRPLYHLSEKKQIRLKFVKPFSNIITAKEVSKLITEDTSLIVLGEMSNVTGALHEVAEIGMLAREKSIVTIIDAAQSLGHTSSDYTNMDIIAASGHKGLHSPQGTGFLFFRENIKLQPLIYGGTGTKSKMTKQPLEPPEAFESGTVNTLGFAGLAAGIEWSLAHQKKINAKIHTLSRLLIENLRKVNGVALYTDNYNGVVSFNLKNMPSTEVASKLDADYGIAVRSGLHCAPLAHRHLGTISQGTVRASVGYNNTASDIYKLVNAIDIIAKGK